MPPVLTLAIYCALIVAMSLLGGWIPMLVRLTHKRMELALSFISGVMLGVALLVLLPHALEARAEQWGSHAPENAWSSHGLAHYLVNPVILWLLGGFLAMFLIERFFCFHHHEPPPVPGAPGQDGIALAARPPAAHDEPRHEHARDAAVGRPPPPSPPPAHAHDVHHHAAGHALHDHAHDHDHSHAHTLRWSGAAIGLTLHSLIDGVALAASVKAGQAEIGDGGAAVWLAGFGTFLVVLLHKPFDSLTLGTLMAAGKHARSTLHVVNLAFALLVPVGAGLFMLGLMAGESQSLVLSAALAFSAGTFLCIALSDLLPELQFHHHDRVKLSAALVLGLAVAWGVAAMEQRLHVHEHDVSEETMPVPAASGHEGHGH